MRPAGILTLFVLGVLVIGALMAILPQYSVWQQGLSGQAELARAQQNRQIRINEAQAKLEASKFEAAADVERAKGIAEANNIISQGLGGPEGYLRWRYIEMLQETGGRGRETIYVPTEAGIPILEAGKRRQYRE